MADHNSYEMPNSEVPNSQILHDFGTTFPLTLHDLILSDMNETKKLNIFLRICTSPLRWKIWEQLPLAWTFSRKLASLEYQFPIGDNLPSDTSAQHNVFLVSRPRGMFQVSTKHWSLYCQGFFYHLKKETFVATTSSTLDSRTMPIKLSIENYQQRKNVALVAYHVGKTDYPAEAIERLARWIVEDFQTYNYFEENCHNFVISLMLRILMADRDYSVFVGTPGQFVYWDQFGREIGVESFFDREHGFLIRNPRKTGTSTSWRDKPPFLYYRQPSGFYISAIGRLYDHGERSPGAFDPERSRSPSRYLVHLLTEDLSELRIGFNQMCKEFDEGTKEFLEDISKGKWRSALIGRPETRAKHRLLRYTRIKDRAKKGSITARWTLLLCIPKEFEERPNPLVSYCPTSYSRYQKSHRQISDKPTGFDNCDIFWAQSENRQNHKAEVEHFLAPCIQNPEKCFNIGIAFLKPRNHAAIILRDYDMNTNSSKRFKTIYNLHPNHKLPDNEVRLLHICWKKDSEEEFELKLGLPRRELEVGRYHELFCVPTTERRLRHIALQSCPETHQYLQADCATFTSNFLIGVLFYLEKQCIISSAKPYISYLERHIHIYEGLVGLTETGSRQHEVLGDSGRVFVESAFTI